MPHKEIKPITPAEARKKFAYSIPDFIIEAVNKLITAKIGTSKSVTLTQEEILEKIGASEREEKFRKQVHEKKWLDFEPIYRKAGWKVVYDKPGFNESYEPTFTFTAK